MLGHHMLISGNLYLIFFSLSRVCVRYSMFNAITELINVSTVIIIINFDIHKMSILFCSSQEVLIHVLLMTEDLPSRLNKV